MGVAITMPLCRTFYLSVCLLVCVLCSSAAQDSRVINPFTDERWVSRLRDSNLVAMPLLFDTDGDGYKDIIVPSFSGEVWAVHGENGHIVDNWPFYLEDRAFYASPLVYDINKDGKLEFLLTTSDAEVVFLQIDNTLLHGETIKVPPLRVKKDWYLLDQNDRDKLLQEMEKQLAELHFPDSSNSKVEKTQDPYSEYESRYGRHADPLYSKSQPEKRPSGIDPNDPSYVFVDPHVMATPVLTDLDRDGIENELVIPVSFYYDPFYYGALNTVDVLGLEKSDLAHFVAGGVVIINLDTRQITASKVLGMSEAKVSQPAYVLATPTVVDLSPGLGTKLIAIGSAKGELHLLKGDSLESEDGFPVLMDAVSAQVAVADVNKDGSLDLVVGDHSGNVYCIDKTGKKLWEFEAHGSPIMSSARFADVYNDGTLDVVLVTLTGALWVLEGHTGIPLPAQGGTQSHFPISLSTHTDSSVLLVQLSNAGSLYAVVPGFADLYTIDLTTGSTDSTPVRHPLVHILLDDIDPLHEGLELLGVSVDGHLTCLVPAHKIHDAYSVAHQSWSGDVLGQNGFTHKSASFAVVLPDTNSTTWELNGRSFNLDLELYHNVKGSQAARTYSLVVAIGRLLTLYNSTLPVHQQRNVYSLPIKTPSVPITAVMSVKVCNEYRQCITAHYNVRFNTHFEDNLKWFLAVPFISMASMFLWLLRNEGDARQLPLTHTPRKDL